MTHSQVRRSCPVAWAAGSLLSSKAALPSAPSWGPILCLHPPSPSGAHRAVTKAEDPVDVKRCQSSMWAHEGGAGPRQFPSWGPHHSSGRTQKAAAGLGHEVVPATRPLEASSWEAQGRPHRAHRSTRNTGAQASVSLQCLARQGPRLPLLHTRQPLQTGLRHPRATVCVFSEDAGPDGHLTARVSLPDLGPEPASSPPS